MDRLVPSAVIRRPGPAALLAAALLALPAAAGTEGLRTFRYASQGDALDLDPHGANEGQTNAIRQEIFEGLVWRSADLALHPALAESWTRPGPTTWRFRLRKNVRFHDGTPFTADDVVFSFKRANHRNSDMKTYAALVKDVVRVDDHTVDFLTDGPDPILLQKLPYHFVMSRRWAEQNGALEPPDRFTKEAPTARAANGTGPFRLVERVPDTRILLEANAAWWGAGGGKVDLARAEYRPIANAATRVAALLSGEVDLVYPVPPQDLVRIRGASGFRALEGPEVRTIYLGFDHFRDELLDMPGSGKNPFKDLRIRRAVYQAVDVKAIHDKVMRGSSRVTALLVAPAVQGYDPKLEARLPYHPEAARKLLAEAGWPQGFAVTMDCPNDRYVNDEAICQAVVPMLARIGVKVSLNAQTKSKFFDKVRSHQTSFFLGGWASTTFDAHYTLSNLLVEQPPGPSWNFGRYSTPRMEALTKAIGVEMDPARRQSLVSEALQLARDDVAYVPLHDQTVAWAARQGVEVPLAPDNIPRLRQVRLAR